MSTVGILGTGTWGTALACLLDGKGHHVTAWSHTPAQAATLNTDRAHPNLPGVPIPAGISFTADAAQACQNKDLLLIVVPSHAMREAAALAKPHIQPDQIIAIATKGIETNTLLTMSEVVEDELAGMPVRTVALSGPTHAEEVSIGLPSAIVAASASADAARFVQETLTGPAMRVYTQKDITGVELCGAFKNVIALACGIAVGLGYGDNTKAALITRGMEEIKRLGMALGCDERTFDGLAGIGDLVVTATSMHSRNNRAGILLGQGLSAQEAVAEIGMVVEGLNALPAAVALARREGVDMPITFAVERIVAGELSPRDAVTTLMERDPRAEGAS